MRLVRENRVRRQAGEKAKTYAFSPRNTKRKSPPNLFFLSGRLPPPHGFGDWLVGRSDDAAYALHTTAPCGAGTSLAGGPLDEGECPGDAVHDEIVGLAPEENKRQK